MTVRVLLYVITLGLFGSSLAGCANKDPTPKAMTPGKLFERLHDLLDKEPAIEYVAVDPDGLPGAERDDFCHTFARSRRVISRDQALRLVRALENGATSSWHICFEPRHGLSVVSSGQQIELCICFECCWMRVYIDGARSLDIGLDDSPRPVFDEIADEVKLDVDGRMHQEGE